MNMVLQGPWEDENIMEVNKSIFFQALSKNIINQCLKDMCLTKGHDYIFVIASGCIKIHFALDTVMWVE